MAVKQRTKTGEINAEMQLTIRTHTKKLKGKVDNFVLSANTFSEFTVADRRTQLILSRYEDYLTIR